MIKLLYPMYFLRDMLPIVGCMLVDLVWFRILVSLDTITNQTNYCPPFTHFSYFITQTQT